MVESTFKPWVKFCPPSCLYVSKWKAHSWDSSSSSWFSQLFLSASRLSTHSCWSFRRCSVRRHIRTLLHTDEEANFGANVLSEPCRKKHSKHLIGFHLSYLLHFGRKVATSCPGSGRLWVHVLAWGLYVGKLHDLTVPVWVLARLSLSFFRSL